MALNPVMLHKFLPAWGLPDISPFCVKVELYCKMAGIPYSTTLGDVRKAPRGKMPLLVDGSRTIADSSAIVAHLEATRGHPLDAWLSPRQLAVATAVRSMLEEHLYFLVLYLRWQPDDGFRVYRPTLIALLGAYGVPRPLAALMALRARRRVKATLHSQGTARHSREELEATGVRVLDAVGQLCEGPFFFGEQPSSLDATVFAFVQGIVAAPFEGPLKDHARRHPKLRAYYEHVRGEYFKES
jgi:glutathione S-transferase